MTEQRQAVVLIHGIGEQRPMDTLRGFVAGLSDDPHYSKPDRLSESFELRRYTLPGTRSRPITDCYELYWAHHFAEGRLRETLRWAGAIVVRKPFWRLDSTLRVPIGALQVTGAAIVVLVGWLLVEQTVTSSAEEVWKAWQARVALVLFVAQLLLGRFITGALADAARYLTPRPRNIAARNDIRGEGIQLIRRLHDDGTYQRIVVVGHSLGSVIGLDVLRLAWDDLRHPRPLVPQKQPEAKAFDSTAADLGQAPGAAQLDTFQAAQHALWREDRACGVPWLVTDFITMGSPLAHASLLLDTRRVTLAQRQVEREYPRCPPTPDSDVSFVKETYAVEGMPRSVLVGHHGALFGPTRWSNLYFPVHRGVLGDPIGGPVGPEFGPGIRDIPVRLSSTGWRSRVFQLLLLPHTRYWKGQRQKRTQPTELTDAVTALRQVIGLEIRRAKVPYPPPGPPA